MDQNRKFIFFRFIILLTGSISLLACTPNGVFKSASLPSTVEMPGAIPPTEQSPPGDGSSPQPTPPPTEPTPPGPIDTPFPFDKMEPLLWEISIPQGKIWSEFVFRVLTEDATDMIERADDLDLFCPKYNDLKPHQKTNVVALLISAIVKYESDFNPVARLPEPSLGDDDVTGLPVVSEGLMQLSYQDEIGRPYCNFNWEADRKLSPTDPKKSILNPFNNLFCGIQILAEQVSRHRLIVIDRGAYWAVIKKNGKYQKISAISRLVQSLKFCQ